MKILIVDDEADYTSVLQITLEMTGRYEVRTVNYSMIALPVALQMRPVVILLDVVMPGMDGGDVLRQFETHALLKRTPVIFVTALASPGEAPTESGGRLILNKPVTLEKLELTIQAALDRTGTTPAKNAGAPY